MVIYLMKFEFEISQNEKTKLFDSPIGNLLNLK